MKKFLFPLILLLGACSQNSLEKKSHIIDDSKEPQYLFVISSQSGTYENETLSLKAIPLVIYFTDRPYRKAGHISLQDFLKEWKQDKSPSAALSIANGKETEDIVIEISDPELKNDTLTFKIKIEENSLPKTFGPSSLFIDYETSK